MKKWHQKSIAIFTAAACLLAGGTIGLSQESLSKLQLTAAAETENTNLVGASFGWNWNMTIWMTELWRLQNL